MKFKIGDRVEIVLSDVRAGVRTTDIGKIGTIVGIFNFPDNRQTLLLELFNLCEGRYQKWSVSNRIVSLAFEKNEQLLFEFIR